MTIAQQLNKEAIDRLENLHAHGHFETIQIVDSLIRKNANKFDKHFYYEQEDTLTEVYGELLDVYGTLMAQYYNYLSSRKFEATVEYSTNKYVTINGKAIKFSISTLGNTFLEDLIKAEIQDLCKTISILKANIDRVKNSIQTCRNHTYGGENGNK